MPKEQYLTVREFTIFKEELKEWNEKIHKKAGEIAIINTKLDSYAEIDIKLDKLYNAFIDFKEHYAKESVNCLNHAKEIDAIKEIIKNDLITKDRFEETVKHIFIETKSQNKLWGIGGLAIGVVVSVILLAILGTQLPT